MEPPSKILRLDSAKQMSAGPSKEAESLFDEYMDYIDKNQVHDPVEFFRKWNAPRRKELKTPPVIMKDFCASTLKDNILWNICRQNLSLTENTTKILIQFLNKKFISLYDQICLQIFVHCTKINTRGNATIYNNYLRTYMNLALETSNVNSADIVQLAAKDTDDFIKKNLVKPPMILSLKKSLGYLFKNENVFDDNSLMKIIKEMKIYTANQFPPISDLRGACLLDGILLCTKNISARDSVPEIYNADLTTLAGHEACHHIGRIYDDNFNMSCPYKKGLESEEVKYDSTGCLLEMGRCFELNLFDNVQPMWGNCSRRAAEEFLKRLDTNKEIPLIKHEEFETLNFESRMTPSSSFGIDLVEERACLF